MTKDEALKVLGVSYSTLMRWVKKGKIRVYKYHTPGKAGWNNYWEDDVYAMVGKKISKGHLIVGYCRTKFNWKEDQAKMQEQKDLMRKFCTARGIALDQIYEERAHSTDLSRKGRPQLHQLMQEIMKGNIDAVVIDTRCRISRVGFEIWEHLCKYHGCDIVVMNPALTDDYYLNEQSEDLAKLIEQAGLDRSMPSEAKATRKSGDGSDK
jgi:excisionase family DNA binding protein